MKIRYYQQKKDYFRLTDKKTNFWLPKGKGGGEDKLGVRD